MDESFENEAVQFGLAVKKIRESRGLTQEDVMNRTGIARSSIVDIEAGKRLPQLLNLLRLCIVFEITPVQLMEVAFKKWKHPVRPNAFLFSNFSQKNSVATAKERELCERRRKTTSKKDISRSARSCGGGQKCYNKTTIKDFRRKLSDTKVVVFKWITNSKFLDVG